MALGAMGASFYLALSPTEPGADLPRHVLVSTINPNKAPLAALLCLPGIGPTRARAIVEYRRSCRRSGHSLAFQDANDLTRVNGIGMVIVDRMRPCLSFASR